MLIFNSKLWQQKFDVKHNNVVEYQFQKRISKGQKLMKTLHSVYNILKLLTTEYKLYFNIQIKHKFALKL